MGNGPAISVIMPVYNAEGFVGDAILSILVQDFTDYELILVDDGSRDRSGAICDRYAACDHRIRVVHQENAGMCTARNVGVSLARGEFVTFCDNDDIFLPGLLSSAYAATQVGDGPVDCVSYGRVRILIDADGRELSYDDGRPAESKVVEGRTAEALVDWLSAPQGVWCHLYRTSMLRENGLTFDVRLVNGAEDNIFNLDVFPHLGHIAFVPETYYVWQQRRGESASLRFTESRRLGMATYVEKLHDTLVAFGVDGADPARFKALMLGPFRVEAGILTYLTSATYAEKCDIYRFFAELYTPYLDEIRKLPGSLPTMLALESAVHGLYLPLYAATHAAVPLHHLRQRLLSGMGG